MAINPGLDISGNNNNWTPNNINFTSSGSTFDTMTDVPTNTNATTANFCVWNPLNKSSTQSATNGNLTASSSGGTSYGAMCATMGVSSGKWYWEMTYTRNGTTNSPVIGFGNDLFNYSNPPGGYLGSDLNAGGINVINGNASINGGSTAYGSAIATNDVVMFAMDLDNRKFYIGKNGTWFNSGDPVAGTNSWPYSANILGSTFFPAVNMFNDSAATNFGQTSFTYTPPSGFVALNTFNLPTPTIGATASTQAGDYFNPVLYTGNGTTLAVTGVGFQPDFVWIKERNDTGSHGLFDVIRGGGARLISNDTAAESTGTNRIQSFDSDGFTVGSLSTINGSGDSMVAWNWKANGTGVSNTDGSITSTVSANTSAGFSVVTYTSTTGTVGHGLGVAPAMIIMKGRNVTDQWTVGHKSINGGSSPWNYGLALNSTGAQDANSGFWNNTAPTSTVFSQGSWDSGYTKVAYCFAEVAGYSAFGSYTGNGSADGTFVYTGFRPRYVMYKRSDSTGGWNILDTTRNPSNVVGEYINANLSDAEANATIMDITSNGFKMRNTFSSANASGGTYIYMAFAETPFNYANAR